MCTPPTRLSRPRRAPPTRRRASWSRATTSRAGRLLCNGVVVFDDTGEILPDGRTVAPHRAQVRRLVAA